MEILLCVLICLAFVIQNESARILAVFPVPLISHQSAYRSILHELINRNHEVVLITPLPEYTKGSSPENLMEIDVSNVTKTIWEEVYTLGLSKDSTGDTHILQVTANIVESQFKIPEVKSFINNNETFDLLLLDGWIRPTLFWTYVFNVPVISIYCMDPVHPIVYPTSLLNEMHNLNVWQKIVAVYEFWKMESTYNLLEKEENEMARRLFGEVPPLSKQAEKIEMVLYNIHPVWQGVRPLPMNVIHLGAVQLLDRYHKTEMSEDLKAYLDLGSNGVVYVNIGSNRVQGPEHVRKFVQAFSKLPCSVLWNFNDNIKELPRNVRVGKWLPEAEILKHPNVRLFVSQSEQQSIDAAIAAAVPLLAVPQAADQWRNAAQLLRHNVGTVLDLKKVEDVEFANIIELTMRNESYRTNMMRIRTLLSDVPAPAPERAVNAIEYVLRHTARYIASPTLHVQWYQYMEIQLFLTVITVLSMCTFLLYKVLHYLYVEKIVRYYKERKATGNGFLKSFTLVTILLL